MHKPFVHSKQHERRIQFHTHIVSTRFTLQSRRPAFTLLLMGLSPIPIGVVLMPLNHAVAFVGKTEKERTLFLNFMFRRLSPEIFQTPFCHLHLLRNATALNTLHGVISCKTTRSDNTGSTGVHVRGGLISVKIFFP